MAHGAAHRGNQGTSIQIPSRRRQPYRPGRPTCCCASRTAENSTTGPKAAAKARPSKGNHPEYRAVGVPRQSNTDGRNNQYRHPRHDHLGLAAQLDAKHILRKILRNAGGRRQQLAVLRWTSSPPRIPERITPAVMANRVPCWLIKSASLMIIVSASLLLVRKGTLPATETL